jgi:signal transduction histidine kinase
MRVLFVHEGDRFRLLVEDNGVGMSGDIKGSGLGLHLLQGFSRALKGNIDIKSTSQGTAATVTFEAPPLECRTEFEQHSTLMH